MPQRTVCAAVVGLPNVGKSTLVNALVGGKIAIISPKPQTTRTRILGVVTAGETQYLFTDTPGFHDPRTALGEHMVKAVRDSVAGVDCAVFVTWAKSEFSSQELALLAEIKRARVPAILCINKSDAFKDPSDGERAKESLSSQCDFAAFAVTSALDGRGVDGLMETIANFAVEGPHLFDEDAITDMPERAIASELIRESLLENLRDELPHGCAVSVERFSERPDRPLIDIEAEIICEKSSHKGMIIGKGGAMLKLIGGSARAKLEDFLACRVNLKLWVKVREGWRDSESAIRSLGM